MSTIHQLWQQYCDDPENEEITEALCERVRKFARIVLKRIKINYKLTPYEDLMQLAFACFFHIALVYKEGAGTLEGYFIYSFNNEVTRFIKSSKPFMRSSTNDIIDDAYNPLSLMLTGELHTEIEVILSEEELRILDTYLKEGIHDYDYIAEVEQTTINDIKWIISAIQIKVRSLLDVGRYD